MAIYGYTKNYKLIKPQFDTDTWHDYVYDNLDTIDAVLSAIFASGDWQGFWKTNTHYNVGGVVIDRATDTMYKVMVEHTTSEATFAEEFAAHPTYYELWSPNNLAEDWAIKMDGQVSNTDYSAKAYAVSADLIDSGSAQEWAIKSGTIGTTGEYSAKKYATDAHNDYISMTTDANVVAVGTNITNVNTVSANISDVNTTATNISNVNTVAGDISRVGLVADDISSVHTVAVDISNVIDVAANKTNIDTVAGVSTDVTTVASIATAVSNVSGIESEVLDVSDNRTDISTVASNISDVNTVAGISGNVWTVASNNTNVTTVATNISDINTTAANITAIQNAPTAATNAANSATASATSANNSHIWAEGTDEQVQALGGIHSAERWAAIVGNRSTTDLDNLTSVGEAHFVNPDVSNLSNSGKAYISGLGLPSNQVQQFTLLSSGQSYTAPSNGWFSVIAAPDANSYILLSRSDSAMRSFYRNTGAGPVSAGVFLPVLEGTSVSYTYSGTFYNGQNSILFIPAKGDV